MTTETVKTSVEGGLALLTIDRPAALNAISRQVLDDLETAIREVEAMAEVRVVAITGGGAKAFIAGADIAEMAAMTSSEAQAFAARGGDIGKAIERSRLPFVALVQGFAFGGGCEVALACDFIYASSGAKFGQPEVKLAVIPGFGGTQRLLRRVGLSKAKELCLVGDTIDAQEALRIGLVDKLFATPEEMKEAATALAQRVSATGPLAVAACKRVLDAGQSMTLDEGLRVEQQAFGHLFSSADQKEGMAAFLAKRAPQYKGE